MEQLLERQSRVLEQVSAFQMSAGKGDSRREVLSPTDTASPRLTRSGPTVADKNSRSAPMSLIRDMKQHILGVERAWGGWDASDDVVSKGIITEETTRVLLSGFSQLSKRWLFMRSVPEAIRQDSPLLFTTCLLAGLHIEPKLHGSEIHRRLYQHYTDLVGKAILCTPLTMETIQSIFIASMWNLVPDKDTGYTDSWLLSGFAAMHFMLSVNFEQILQPKKDDRVDPKAREALRTWNLICLCHLQFSIGTGRPSIISSRYLDQCGNILTLRQLDPRDQLVAAGITLYSHVSQLLNSDSVQTDSLEWDEIEEWKRSCDEFYDLEVFKPLQFAYSCSYLILGRRTIKHMSESAPPSPAHSPRLHEKARPGAEDFIHLCVKHSISILTIFTSMSIITSYVRPSYENLLCSYAMVTLSEFAGYLTGTPGADEVLALMERTSIHIQLGGKAEPVGRWALSVLRKFVYDNKDERGESSAGQLPAQTGGQVDAVPGFAVGEQGVSGGDDPAVLGIPPDLGGLMWGPEAFADQEFPFPSLEDMFLTS